MCLDLSFKRAKKLWIEGENSVDLCYEFQRPWLEKPHSVENLLNRDLKNFPQSNARVATRLNEILLSQKLWPRPGLTEQYLPQPFTPRDVFMFRRYDLAITIAFTHPKVLLKIIKSRHGRVEWCGRQGQKRVRKFLCFTQVVFTCGNLTWRFFFVTRI